MKVLIGFYGDQVEEHENVEWVGKHSTLDFLQVDVASSTTAPRHHVFHPLNRIQRVIVICEDE